MEIDETLIMSDSSLSIREGAIQAWRRSGHHVVMYYNYLLRELSSHYGFSLNTPFKKLDKKIRDIILYGTGEDVPRKTSGLLRGFAQKGKAG